MRHRSKVSILVGIFFSLPCFAQNDEFFRTPAKLYAGAYSVKMLLKKGFTEYDVPVWIKPDQAESTIDLSLIKDLGYVGEQIIFDEVKISNELLEKKKFKNMKSEWAFVPDFAKSCCYGVIGRDILQGFEIRFDPKSPSHLEWTRLISDEKIPEPKSAFLAQLKKLFSLTQLLEVPFVLKLQEQKLVFEAPIPKVQQSLFSFSFVPPQRTVRVQSVSSKDASAAKKAQFVSGLIITEINGEKVDQLDRWQIEKYLRGEMSPSIKFVTTKKEFLFDFTTRSFK